jgi:DNA-binding CsgD family transcriptional regulator
MEGARLGIFSDLVESIHEAALAPDLWSHIPQRIAELHDSPKAIFFAVRQAGRPSAFQYAHGIEAQALEIWNAGTAGDDIWFSTALRKNAFNAGSVARGEDLVPDDVFLASEYYRNFLARFDMRYLLSGVVLDGTHASLPPSACAVLRGHGATPYDESHVRMHRLLTRHLSRAMGTMRRLKSDELEIASTHAALDRLSTAVLLMTENSTVAFANAPALELVRRGEGISLRQSTEGGDDVVFADAGVQGRFDQSLKWVLSSDWIDEAAESFEGIRLPLPSGELLVQLSAIPAGNEFSRGGPEHRAIVFITDTSESHRLDVRLLAGLYGLTQAEIRLTEMLMSGESLAKVAFGLRLSENTVKKQLQGVFEKTRTHKQVQLMRLLMALGAIRSEGVRPVFAPTSPLF